MAQVLTITGPIFLLIGIGYLAVRSGLIQQSALPGMGRFVLHLALPALIFTTISRLEFQAIVEPAYLLVYGVASVVTLALGIVFSRFIRGQSLAASGVMGLGMSMSNSAFIGYPVLMQVFQDPPAQAFAMSLMIENILVIPLALAIIEYGSSEGGAGPSFGERMQAVAGRLVRNPLLLAIAAGMLVSLLDPPMPAGVLRTLDMLAGASVSVALFTIGGTLVGNPIRSDLGSIAPVLAGKLLIHPLLVFVLLMLSPGLSGQLRLSMILLAAMPMLSVFPIIGGNYGLGRLCASTLLLTTVLSFASLSALIALLT